MSYYRIENIPPPPCPSLTEIKCEAQPSVCTWRMRSEDPTLKAPRTYDYCASLPGRKTRSVSQTELRHIIGRAIEDGKSVIPKIYRVTRRPASLPSRRRKIEIISPEAAIAAILHSNVPSTVSVTSPSIPPAVNIPSGVNIPSTVNIPSGVNIPSTVNIPSGVNIPPPSISPGPIPTIGFALPPFPYTAELVSPPARPIYAARLIAPPVPSLAEIKKPAPTIAPENYLSSLEFKSFIKNLHNSGFTRKVCEYYTPEQLARIAIGLGGKINTGDGVNKICGKIISQVSNILEDYSPREFKDIKVCESKDNENERVIYGRILSEQSKNQFGEMGAIPEEFFADSIPTRLCQATRLLDTELYTTDENTINEILNDELPGFDPSVQAWWKKIADEKSAREQYKSYFARPEFQNIAFQDNVENSCLTYPDETVRRVANELNLIDLKTAVDKKILCDRIDKYITNIFNKYATTQFSEASCLRDTDRKALEINLRWLSREMKIEIPENWYSSLNPIRLCEALQVLRWIIAGRELTRENLRTLDPEVQRWARKIK